MLPATGRSFSPSRTARREPLPDNRCCCRSAFRSSSFTSRPPTTSCGTRESISSKRIFWGRRDNPKARRSGRAAVRADRIGGGAAPGHLVLQLIEAAARIRLAVMNHLDRGIAAHRATDDGGRILADGLVHIVFAV